MVWSFNLQAFCSFCLNCFHPPTHRSRNQQINRNNQEPNSIQLILTNPVACTSYTSVPQSSAADKPTEDWKWQKSTTNGHRPWCGHVIRQTPNKSCSDCQAVSNFCIAFFFCLCHFFMPHKTETCQDLDRQCEHSFKYFSFHEIY